MIAVIFPGQGVHYAGMWRRMGERVGPKIYHRYTELLSKVVEDSEPDNAAWLDQCTANAQPTILACSLAYYEASGVPGDVLLGHSLGEYAALVAAGAMSAQEAIWLVRQRGLVMAQIKGSLHAISFSASSSSKIDFPEGEGIYASAHNAANQWNVAADSSERIVAWCKQLGIRKHRRLTDYPFHSPLMTPAVGPFTAALAAIDFSERKRPVISNVTARPHSDLKPMLIRHVTEMVKWQESIEYCLQAGVTKFIEMGPNCLYSRLLLRDHPQIFVE